MTKQLCKNCGSEWDSPEPNREYSEILKKWIDKEQVYCSECIIDLGIEEE